MKALFYPSFGQLLVNEQPIPAYNDSEVLLKVAACGICGSELETFISKSMRRKPPVIMGHEFSGVIVKKGNAVEGWEPGMRVVSNSIISCGECVRCRTGETNLCIQRQVFGMQHNGAFAEYVNVPAHCLIPVPESLSLKEACLAEPLANAVHMVRMTSHINIKRILVIGSGPIGLMAQQAFQSLRGASVIVADLKEDRLQIAKKLGAKYVINADSVNLTKKVSELVADEEIDVVIDAVGKKGTQSDALQLVRAGGSVILIGLQENAYSLRSYDIILPGKQVMGAYAATSEDIVCALQMMTDKKTDVASWVNYYSLDNGVTAFKNMLDPKNQHIKSVIIMDSNI